SGTTLGTTGLSGGSASFSTANLCAGPHSVTASYSRDSNYSISSSSPFSQTVNQAGTTISVSSSNNPSTSGQNVTFTATVSAPAATGTGKFYGGATGLGSSALSGGKASLSTSTLSAGSHSITSSYSGDTNYSGSNSPTLTQ